MPEMLCGDCCLSAETSTIPQEDDWTCSISWPSETKWSSFHKCNLKPGLQNCEVVWYWQIQSIWGFSGCVRRKYCWHDSASVEDVSGWRHTTVIPHHWGWQHWRHKASSELVLAACTEILWIVSIWRGRKSLFMSWWLFNDYLMIS